jgi:flagellar FliJ protein
MAKFNYKFENVKKIKETFKTKAQKELAEVEHRIEITLREIEKILTEKRNLKKEFYSNSKQKASDLHSRIYYENFLGGLIISLEAKLVALNKEKDERLKVLTQRSKEHKIFETLEEKHYENFLFEENKNEQIQIDDIAVKRYVRGQN